MKHPDDWHIFRAVAATRGTGLTENNRENLEAEELETDEGATDDVALRPGPNADAPDDVERYISAEVRELYDVYSYRHAAAILANSFPDELAEIERALLAFRITTRDIGMPGG